MDASVRVTLTSILADMNFIRDERLPVEPTAGDLGVLGSLKRRAVAGASALTRDDGLCLVCGMCHYVVCCLHRDMFHSTCRSGEHTLNAETGSSEL